jgi:hypothetical protein
MLASNRKIRQRGAAMVHFYHRRSIHGVERVEYYRLFTQADGSHLVEYEWTTSDRYGAKIDASQIRLPVSEFLAGTYDESAKAALISYLNASTGSPTSE